MSEEKKDNLTSVEIKKREEEIHASLKETNQKIQMLKNMPHMIAEGINKSAGSPFSSPIFGEMVFNQLSNIIISKEEMLEPGKGLDDLIIFIRKIIDKFTVLFDGIKPQDQIEGMLAAQMIGIHYATMEAFAKSRNFKDPDIVNAFLNSATKLSRTYTMQMEALNRHRGKGQQKMTVEHVHVNAGGQAIIGTVQSHGKKKKAGGGSDGGKTK